MKEKKKGKQMSGGAKLKASGKKAIMLAVTPDDLDLIRAAAALERRPVSQFVAYYALEMAKNVIAGLDGGDLRRPGRRQGSKPIPN